MENRITAEALLAKINQEKAKKRDELIRTMNKDAENGFWNFCKYLYPEFFKDEQTERVRYASVLQNCGLYSLTGDDKYRKYRKVMINIFPRFGKSFMLSIWTVWLLWHYNEGSVMRNAHDASLAEKFSRDVRNMIEAPNTEDDIDTDVVSVAGRLNAIAPKLKLSRDKRALSSWALKTSKDVAYFCAGTGGSITGKGFDLAMILDDPVKSPEVALSPTFNEDLLTWYLTVHRSRRNRESAVFGCEVIVMARWSSDDLCKKLLDAEDDWYVVNFDIEDGEGNSACPSVVSTKEMLEMKKGFANTARLHWWNALYRQKIDTLNKMLFKKEEIKRFDPSEHNFTNKARWQTVAYCDTADEGLDNLAMPIAQWDTMTGELYVIDAVFSTEPAEITRVMVAKKIQEHKIDIIVFESNNGGKFFAELCFYALKELNTEAQNRIENLKRKQTEASGADREMITQEIKRLQDTIYQDMMYESKYTTTNKITKILTYSSLVLSSVYFLEDALLDKASEYSFFLRELFNFQKERRNLHDDAPDSITSMAQRFCASNSFEMF